VEDDLRALHRVADAVAVGDVAGDDFEVVAAIEAVEPAPRLQGVVVDQCPDPGPVREEALGEVAADEAAGAGDEDALAIPVHAAYLPVLTSCWAWS
jgi:hypothetical protein